MFQAPLALTSLTLWVSDARRPDVLSVTFVDLETHTCPPGSSCNSGTHQTHMREGVDVHSSSRLQETEGRQGRVTTSLSSVATFTERRQCVLPCATAVCRTQMRTHRQHGSLACGEAFKGRWQVCCVFGQVGDCAQRRRGRFSLAGASRASRRPEGECQGTVKTVSG